MPEEIQKRMKYAVDITRKERSKPRTSSSNRNDENKRPTAVSRSGASLKHSSELGKEKKKELPRNSSYGRLGMGHETARDY